MDNHFSGVLKLTDLNDFIKPSQECIKPTKINRIRNINNKVKDDGNYYAESDGEKLERVQLSLTDCLACSGCITSAESVLITQQSQEELFKIFDLNSKLKKENKLDECKCIIVSLSIQAILSLSIRYQVTPNECAAKLATYFKKLGADMVLDMSIAEDIALLENQKEFIERFKKADNNSIPMLASSCPGWVCYAEKTHAFILPNISNTKSPQQIIGSLVTKYLKEEKKFREIYHVTVMPCFDKKLEASRQEFNKNEEMEVNCVITSVELEQMLENLDFAALEASTLFQPWIKSEDIETPPNLTKRIGSGSGGYAHHIFQYAAKKLFNVECNNIEFKELRNPDFKETLLEIDNQVVLRFAIINGFKNIQNLVQKMKRGKCNYHYVEIMACPSGCMNGGAQIKSQNNLSAKELSNRLDQLYESLPCQLPSENEIVKKLILKDDYFKTKYCAVEKTTNAISIRW